MKVSDLFSGVAEAVPSLASWSAEMSGDPEMSIEESLGHLRAALNDLRHNRRIEWLPKLAPLIERLLEENDDQDQVSIGLIEPLVWDALDGILSAQETRESLGPLGRSTWDSFYLDRRRQDLRAILFEDGHLGAAARGPAKLVEWLLPPNQWVKSGSSVARVAVRDGEALLRVRAQCWIDRFAASPGHSLVPGDLLLYVAPESPAISKDEPLCSLVIQPAA